MSTCPICGDNAGPGPCPSCIKTHNSASVFTRPDDFPSDERPYRQTLIVPHGRGHGDDLVMPTDTLETSLRDISNTKDVVTRRAQVILEQTDEDMVWDGCPSPKVLASRHWKIVVWAFLTLACTALGSPHGLAAGGWEGPVLWFGLAGAIIGLDYFSLRSTAYRISSQRLEVTDGLLHQQTKTYEVHHLGDAIINRPLLHRMVGLSNLTIRHRFSSESDPRSLLARLFTPMPDDFIPACILLEGLSDKSAVRIREILRQAGQIEAQRLDKFRVR